MGNFSKPKTSIQILIPSFCPRRETSITLSDSKKQYPLNIKTGLLQNCLHFTYPLDYFDDPKISFTIKGRSHQGCQQLEQTTSFTQTQHILSLKNFSLNAQPIANCQVMSKAIHMDFSPHQSEISTGTINISSSLHHNKNFPITPDAEGKAVINIDVLSNETLHLHAQFSTKIGRDCPHENAMQLVGDQTITTNSENSQTVKFSLQQQKRPCGL